MFDNFLYPKKVTLRDNVEKFGTATQATDDNMASALCMLDE
jgi:hypothetical protein